MMRGLFGKTKGLEGMKLPAMDSPMPNEITYTPQAQAIMSGEAPMPAKQGFDWKNVLLQTLGGAADGAATFFGGEPVIRQNMQMQQMMAMRQAEEQRRRAAELADYRTKLGIQQEFAGPPEPTEFERALTMAGIDPRSPEGQALARERAMRMAQGPDPLLQGAPLPNGGTYTGPFSGYAGMARGGQTASAPDTLPPDFFDSPSDGSPMKAPAQPIRGARTITRQEYSRILQSMGGDQRRMNAWMTQNNVVAGN